MPALFLLSLPTLADIQLAIIDTGFCPSLIKKTPLLEVLPVVDLTESVSMDCKKNTGERFHGQRLLEEFLRFYVPKKEKLTVHPLIVFDQKNEQRPQYWQRALLYLEKNKIDLVLSASGLPISSDEALLKEQLKGLWFVPSGRTSPFVRKGQRLFPQELAPRENLFLIGDYFLGPPHFYDEELFYQDKIDYFFASGKGQLTGTSRAVGEALGKALSLCPLKKMRSCLKEVSRSVPLSISKKTVLTY